MQLSFTLIIFFKLLISTLHLLKPVHTLPPPPPPPQDTTTTPQPVCRDMCGSVAIKYPFSLDDGCGSPEYRNMLNCTGDLFFQTPSGQYRVRSIDYDKNTMVIYDPAMSTCTMIQPRHDFSLSDVQSVLITPSSDSVFALLNCSIDSPLLNHYRSLCYNFSGHSCDELYTTCASFRILRLPTGVYQQCCFTEYSTLKFMSMNMNILDCTHYTTVYGVDDLKGVGPLDWTYGIKLSYAVRDTGCEHCERSGGTCGFNTETQGMLCLCSTSMNSTRDCGGNSTGGGKKLIPNTLFHVIILVLRSVLGIIL